MPVFTAQELLALLILSLTWLLGAGIGIGLTKLLMDAGKPQRKR